MSVHLMKAKGFMETYQEYGYLFPTDKILQTSLCDYYATIVDFCRLVVQKYSRPGKSLFAFCVFCTKILKCFL